MRIFLMISVILIAGTLYSQKSKDNLIKNTSKDSVDYRSSDNRDTSYKVILANGYGVIGEKIIMEIEQPKYPGGEAAFKELYLMNVLREAVKSNFRNGKYLVQFDVDSIGEAKNFKVLKAPNSDFEKATLKSFKSIQRWIPGMYNGRPINSRLTYFLRYMLVN